PPTRRRSRSSIRKASPRIKTYIGCGNSGSRSLFFGARCRGGGIIMSGRIVRALVLASIAVTTSHAARAGCAYPKEFQLAYSDTGSYDIVFPANADIAVSAGVIGRLWQPGERATTGENTGGGCPDSMWL